MLLLNSISSKTKTTNKQAQTNSPIKHNKLLVSALHYQTNNYQYHYVDHEHLIFDNRIDESLVKDVNDPCEINDPFHHNYDLPIIFKTIAPLYSSSLVNDP